MRKTFLLFATFTSLFAEQKYLYEASPIIGFLENGKETGINRSQGMGIELQYNDLDFFIKPELTYIYTPNAGLYNNPGESVDINIITLNGVYDLEYTALLTPFLKAGMGYLSVTDRPGIESDAYFINSGAGLKLHVMEQLSVKFETLLGVQNFSKSKLLVFVGLDYAFGQEDNTPALVSKPEPVVVEVNTTKESTVFVPPPPVYLSKADYNLTNEERNKQEVVIRDPQNKITSLTIFVPYLFREYQLDSASKDILKKYAQELAKTDAHVRIIGHTGAKGRRAFNQELSLKRAQEVKSLFINSGVKESSIEVEGRGESVLLSEGKDPVSQQLNKRIEIMVTYPEDATSTQLKSPKKP